MKPIIEILAEKKLIGQRISMSLADDRTRELWQTFMPRRREIRNSVGEELYCIQVYGAGFDFEGFAVTSQFEKWAAVEVADFEAIPDGMEAFRMPGGLYAVFIHHGGASTGPETYRYIFRDWLPESGYVIDNRPHFDLLGEKYKNDDLGSEEEIWIPIKPR